MLFYKISGLFWRIQQLEILPNMILYCAVTALATYLMALAYGKVQLVLKHKLAQKREQAINREVAQEIGDRKVRESSIPLYLFLYNL